MDHSFLSAFVLLLLVLDPFGSLPIFISVLKGVPPERRRRVALREALIALGVLLAFMFAGQGFLRLMHLSERSLEVAGGVILLIIAIRMIFSAGAPIYASDGGTASGKMKGSRQPERIAEWIAAVVAAMAVCAAVLLGADRIRKLLGHSMVAAIEKLMGLVLTAVAIEMVLAGLKRYFLAPG